MYNPKKGATSSITEMVKPKEHPGDGNNAGEYCCGRAATKVAVLCALIFKLLEFLGQF